MPKPVPAMVSTSIKTATLTTTSASGAHPILEFTRVSIS